MRTSLGTIGSVDSSVDGGAEQFQALAESLPVIAWTADATGSMNWYNRRWYQYTGQTVDEAVSWGWQTVHHADDFLDVMHRWPECIQTAVPFEMEVRLRKHDGTYRWFLTRATPLLDGDGSVVRWYGIEVDIDAQRYAVDRMRRVGETLSHALLPQALPQGTDWRTDGVYIGAEEDALVGGDWYDAFETSDGRLVLSIGDVTGHGVDASITAARLRQAIFTLATIENDPAAIVSLLDRTLCRQEPGAIATAIVAVVTPGEPRTIAYSVAGHPPPLIARCRGYPAEPLAGGDPPLGLGIERERHTHSAELCDDAVLVMYTDGIVEFKRTIAETEQKLYAAAGLLVGDTTMASPARAIAELVFDDAYANDDAAVLVVQFSPVQAPLPDSEPIEKFWRFHSSSAQAARVVRRQIVNYLRRASTRREDLLDAELIIGEALANTVTHAPGLVEVRLEWVKERPTLTVTDSVPSKNGRRTFLIRRLASDVTVIRMPEGGTPVSVVLPLRRSLR